MTSTRHIAAPLAAAILSILLANCAGGGPKAIPSPGSSSGPVTPSGKASLTATVDLSSGVTLLSKKARTSSAHGQRLKVAGVRTAASVTQIGSVVFDGWLYPSYAGAVPVEDRVIVNTSSVPSTASLTFNNIPAGNNEWVIVGVSAYDSPNATGSSVYLGELGGLANLGQPPAYVTVDAASTQRLQVALNAMYQGLFSTYDLQNRPLDSILSSYIAGSGQTVDSATGLFSQSAMGQLMNGLYNNSQYSHTMQVKSNNTSAASLATIVWDYRNPNEVNYVANVTSIWWDFPMGSPGSGTLGFGIVGNPMRSDGAGTPRTVPSANQPSPVPYYVGAESFDATTGSVTIQHVYGGNLIVGMATLPSTTSSVPPFYGGLVSAPAGWYNVAPVQTVNYANTTITMTVNDPQAAAFGGRVLYYNTYPIGATFNTYCSASAAFCVSSQITAVDPNAGTVTLAINQFNPFALLPNQLQLCADYDCVGISNGATATVRSPFYDAGTNLSYYNWSPCASCGGAATSVTAAASGYTLAYSGGTNGWITTTRASYAHPNLPINISNSSPVGTTWYVQANCAGQTYQNTGVQSGGYARVVMSSVPSIVQCGVMNIGFSLPSGSPSSGSILMYSL